MSAEQGTPEWLAERAGHATASRFSDILAKIKTGEAATRRNYRTQLVTERLTGLPVEGYKNAAMQWGLETEAEAREQIEIMLGHVIMKAEFEKHPKIKWVGCSPDGLIDSDGGCEIKCPFVSTVHVETLQEGMPNAHMAQVQGAMWVTGRKWWLFVSYDPRMPEHLKLYSQVIKRDEEYIKMLQAEVSQFLLDTEQLYSKLFSMDLYKK